MNLSELIKQEKLIAIMRGLGHRQAVQVCKALYKGGIRFAEVTFNQKSPTCIEDAAAAIRAISEQVPQINVGAGTVITLEQVEASYKAGAKYIISPNTDETVIKRTVELGMISMPGAFSPSEIVKAHDWGAGFVKVFPAGNLGVAYIKAIRAPISHIPLLAVGGVNLENMKAFYEAGVCGFGIGANIVNAELVKKEDYEALSSLASRYVATAASLGKD
ncbi:MAG: bifunctional 4-hydroxy-2-oxoglutarate aldolase/2-dehydro-3-deoxy-phosphogluconate aldolase [Clostridia bacterium]|nr:bifunctional 4-hydroxy-2-oxoglutarate aldolase/2-dehydro-3-deoxy-phosphogluconate aldolase [Clostridia bacterium]